MGSLTYTPPFAVYRVIAKLNFNMCHTHWGRQQQQSSSSSSSDLLFPLLVYEALFTYNIITRCSWYASCSSSSSSASSSSSRQLSAIKQSDNNNNNNHFVVYTILYITPYTCQSLGSLSRESCRNKWNEIKFSFHWSLIIPEEISEIMLLHLFIIGNKFQSIHLSMQ